MPTSHIRLLDTRLGTTDRPSVKLVFQRLPGELCFGSEMDQRISQG